MELVDVDTASFDQDSFCMGEKPQGNKEGKVIGILKPDLVRDHKGDAGHHRYHPPQHPALPSTSAHERQPDTGYQCDRSSNACELGCDGTIDRRLHRHVVNQLDAFTAEDPVQVPRHGYIREQAHETVHGHGTLASAESLEPTDVWAVGSHRKHLVAALTQGSYQPFAEMP